MSKSVVQEMIDFVTSDEYNHLYPNVKQEWFNTFLEKEKQQIIDAFLSGDSGMFHFSLPKEWTSATEYYQQLML